MMRMRQAHPSATGFTLIELLVVIAVIAIFATIAVPALQETIKNNRVTSHNNEIVSLINFAKSEAIRRNGRVAVEFFSGAGWEAQVVVDDEDGGPVVDSVPGCPDGALRCAAETGTALDAALTLTFNSRGYLDPFAMVSLYVEHANCTSQRQRRRIEVLPTGQVNSCGVGCGLGLPGGCP